MDSKRIRKREMHEATASGPRAVKRNKESTSLEDDAGAPSACSEDLCDSGFRAPVKNWRNFRLLVVTTAGGTRASPYRFLLAGNNMTKLELVELKHRVMEGWKEWYVNATFKPMLGKLTVSMKSEVIENDDLRVKITVGAGTAGEGGRLWMLLAAEGEDYGDWDEGNAIALFDDKDVAFNADSEID